MTNVVDDGRGVEMRFEKVLSPRVFSWLARPYEWLTTHELQEEAVRALSDRLPRDGWILDVACGPGVVLERVLSLEAGRAGVGVDAAPGTIARAAHRVPAILGRAEHLPFPNRSFAASYVSGALYLMKDPARVIAEMMRVSRDSVVVLEASLALDIGSALDAKSTLGLKSRLDSVLWTMAMSGTRRYDIESLRNVLIQAGLRQIEVDLVAGDLVLIGRGRLGRDT